MSQHREPLTPEEREIADRLARLGASAEPSAALDAGILAAARVAAKPSGGSRPVRQPRRRRRWPVGIGLAASLALAVGVAWQLRPLPDAGVGYSEAPAAATTARNQDAFPAADAGMAGSAAAHEAARDGAGNDSVALEEARSSPPAETLAERQSIPEAEETRETAAKTAASEPAPFVRDAPLPTAFPAAPSPPPPAPAAAPAPRPESSSLASGATAAAREASRERRANAVRTDAAAEADARAGEEPLDRVQVTGSRTRNAEADDVHDQPYDEQPPASADSPEVRKAWLARIRELVAAGEVDAARASLREFRRRYPLAPLPDDLRPLIE